jgi:hypothetical protein
MWSWVLLFCILTQHKWVTDDEGKQTKVEVAKRVKRWWTASVDGKINLVVRYGSKPLEFAKGKNAIELASEAEVADTLRKVREAAELGELDALIEQQAQFGRRLTLKNKWTNVKKNVYGLNKFFVVQCASVDCVTIELQ